MQKMNRRNVKKAPATCRGRRRSKHIAQNPPSHEQDEVHVDHHVVMTHALQRIEPPAVVEPLAKDQREQIRERDDEEGIVSKRLAELQVEQVVQGPLRAASRTVQPRKPVERATGHESRGFGVHEEQNPEACQYYYKYEYLLRHPSFRQISRCRSINGN